VRVTFVQSHGTRGQRSRCRPWLPMIPLIIFASAALGSEQASAAEPNWPSEPYNYIVVDQDLRAALEEFGNHYGMSVQVSDDVHGRVRGKLPPMAPREFLDRLATTYGLAWYYDGSILFVTPVAQMVSKLLPLGGASFTELMNDLKHLEIYDDRYPLRYSPGDKLLLVAGPQRYVDLVEQTLEAVAAQRAPEIRVIRGQHGGTES
jgi:type III secretion protein C